MNAASVPNLEGLILLSDSKIYAGNTAYLGGPMRGYERFNFDAFFEAEEVLAGYGLTIISPARHDVEVYGFDPDGELGDFPMEDALHWDLEQVLTTDGIILLPGWEKSKGASLEHLVAVSVGKPAYQYNPETQKIKPLHRASELLDVGDSPVETVLEEAARLVDGDRLKSYGHPREDFQATAEFWRIWIMRKYGIDVPFEPHDFGMMLILTKVSREANAKKRDNIVDIPGYARTIEKCLYDEVPSDG